MKRNKLTRSACMQPSQVRFCHGKIYVANAYASGAIKGGITKFTVDSKYQVLSQRLVIPTPQPVPLTANKAAWAILGLACDPRDDDTAFKLYFTLSPPYSQGGEKPTKPAPHYGQVPTSSLWQQCPCPLTSLPPPPPATHACSPCMQAMHVLVVDASMLPARCPLLFAPPLRLLAGCSASWNLVADACAELWCVLCR
jgi:hypothetical protein